MQIGLHNPSVTNVLRGLKERVYRVERDGVLVPTPKPSIGAYNQLRDFRSRLLSRLVLCRPWSLERFIASYPGAKQARVRAAAESLALRPLSRRDAMLSTFVKAEKLNLSDKPDPAPRVIQPRDPRYNCVVGPYLKAAEKPIFDAIAEVWGGPTVMKGMSGAKVAECMRSMWDSFSHPVGIGLDASRFDQHVSVPALEWEHSVYNSIFKSPELARLLQWQLHNKGKAFTADAAVDYEVEGCRMSGDMNTSLGNCLLMCAMVWEYARQKRIPCRLANNGDDCMVFMTAAHAAKFRSGLDHWFLAMGFKMKVEDTVHEFERVEFCQTRPVYTGSAWVMCRNPRLVLDKDTTCLHPRNVPYTTWLHHIGVAGGALAAGMPILQEFYRACREAGKPGLVLDVCGMDYLAHGMTLQYTPVTDEARVSFYRAYGITPWQQTAIEQEILANAGALSMPLVSVVRHLPQNTLLNVEDGWL